MKKYLSIISLLLCVGVFANDSTVKKRQYHPHIAHVQYAGNMGFLSIGYSYRFLRDKMTLGFLGGYLPESIGGSRLGTLTLKYAYRPWLLNRKWWGENVRIIPLTVGLNLIKTWGEHIENHWAPHYPDGYYPWNPSMNYAIYLGSILEVQALKERKYFKAIGLFYELGITSRLVELWWDNKETIRFVELWNLSIGLNVNLR